jgi:GNAT superfamily N-acetyltransferase
MEDFPKLVFTVRKANPDDLHQLVRLSRQTFVEAFGSQNKPENMEAYMDTAFSELQLQAELQDPGSVFFLIFSNKEDEDSVGYAKLRNSKKQAALGGYRAVEIQQIYVLERFRGWKVGTADANLSGYGCSVGIPGSMAGRLGAKSQGHCFLPALGF